MNIPHLTPLTSLLCDDYEFSFYGNHFQNVLNHNILVLNGLNLTTHIINGMVSRDHHNVMSWQEISEQDSEDSDPYSAENIYTGDKKLHKHQHQ